MITVNIVLKGEKHEITMPQAKVLYQELQLIFEPATDQAIYPVYTGKTALVRKEEIDREVEQEWA